MVKYPIWVQKKIPLMASRERRAP